MNKIYIILCVILTVVAGCRELVDISGVLLNRLNEPANKYFEIIVITKSQNSELVKDFKIIILEDSDSLQIFPEKLSNAEFPVHFIYPDEQIYVLPDSSKKLTVTAEHPDNGIYISEINISSIGDDKPLVVEFIVNTAY